MQKTLGTMIRRILKIRRKNNLSTAARSFLPSFSVFSTKSEPPFLPSRLGVRLLCFSRYKTSKIPPAMEEFFAVRYPLYRNVKNCESFGHECCHASVDCSANRYECSGFKSDFKTLSLLQLSQTFAYCQLLPCDKCFNSFCLLSDITLPSAGDFMRDVTGFPWSSHGISQSNIPGLEKSCRFRLNCYSNRPCNVT